MNAQSLTPSRPSGSRRAMGQLSRGAALVSALLLTSILPVVATCKGTVTDDGADTVTGDAEWWWGDGAGLVGDASESWDGWAANVDPDAALPCESSCAGTCYAWVCVATVVDGVPPPNSLALDEAYLYWTEPSTGSVVRAPQSGGAPSTVASGQADAGGVIVTDASVYWAVWPHGSSSNVMSAPKAGGPASSVLKWPDALSKFVVDGTSVYWSVNSSAGGSIMRAEAGGGQAVTIVSSDQAVSDFTIAGDAIYFSRAGSYLWVSGAPGGGGGPPIYHHDGTVNRVPVTGGDHIVLAEKQELPAQIVVTNGMVGYATAGALSPGGTVLGWLMSVPATGGDVLTLTKAAGSPVFLAGDIGSVYWTGSYGASKLQATGGAALRLGNMGDGGTVLAVGATRVFWGGDGVADCDAGTRRCSRIYSAPK